MIVLRNLEILGGSSTPEATADITVDAARIDRIDGVPESYSQSAIRFESAFAFPGLINSHEHLEFDCYDRLDGGPYRDYLEWAADVRRRHASTIAVVEAVPRSMRVRLGVARNLLCGVTSVAHHAGAGENPEFDKTSIGIIRGPRVIHSPRLGRLREMWIPERRAVVVHVGEGIDKDSEREIDTLIRRNVWGKSLIGVHAIAMRPDQAARFAAIVWCPASNEFLFGRTAPIAQLKHRTTVLFGTDSTITASWSIWDHLRRARELGFLTDDELIAALTTHAARVWNLPFHGRILAGAAADIVVARKRYDNLRDAFFAIEPEDILLVMKNGLPVMIDASLRSQLSEDLKLFPVTVNGVAKYTAENLRDLALSLRTLLPSIPVPME